jgi:hypothetical protein
MVQCTASRCAGCNSKSCHCCCTSLFVASTLLLLLMLRICCPCSCPGPATGPAAGCCCCHHSMSVAHPLLLLLQLLAASAKCATGIRCQALLVLPMLPCCSCSCCAQPCIVTTAVNRVALTDDATQCMSSPVHGPQMRAQSPPASLAAAAAKQMDPRCLQEDKQGEAQQATHEQSGITTCAAGARSLALQPITLRKVCERGCCMPNLTRLSLSNQRFT